MKELETFPLPNHDILVCPYSNDQTTKETMITVLENLGDMLKHLEKGAVIVHESSQLPLDLAGRSEKIVEFMKKRTGKILVCSFLPLECVIERAYPIYLFSKNTYFSQLPLPDSTPNSRNTENAKNLKIRLTTGRRPDITRSVLDQILEQQIRHNRSTLIHDWKHVVIDKDRSFSKFSQKLRNYMPGLASLPQSSIRTILNTMLREQKQAAEIAVSASQKLFGKNDVLVDIDGTLVIEKNGVLKPNTSLYKDLIALQKSGKNIIIRTGGNVLTEKAKVMQIFSHKELLQLTGQDPQNRIPLSKNVYLGATVKGTLYDDISPQDLKILYGFSIAKHRKP